MTHPMKRRTFLSGSAVAAVAFTGKTEAADTATSEDVFEFEVTRSEAEWRDRLSTEEYNVLRKASTELPRSSDLWNNTAEGIYCCKGCDLTVYDSIWKVELNKGWAFFAQSRKDTVMMGIDGAPPDGMVDLNNPFGAIIEAHCRRCSSHLGHILTVEGKTLHCINGASLTFQAASV